MYKLILASQSPRRKKILTEAGYLYKDLPVNLSETPDKNLNLDEQIIKIAREKAEACLESNNYLKNQSYLILASDTMVIVDGVMLGKPIDKNEAKKFLRLLSGRDHFVKTSVFVLNCQTLEHIEGIDTTKVFFKNLTDNEINSYVESGEPMDKAGAYGIQSLGGTFVDYIDGSMNTVVGLPLILFENLLKKNNWSIEETESSDNLVQENFLKFKNIFEAELLRNNQMKIGSLTKAKLLAVSKTHPLSKIKSVYKKGQRLFGENYVQEANLKVEEARSEHLDIEWHFIGKLQRNKVKDVIGRFALIHSVDNLDLAKKVSSIAEQKQLNQKCLLQLNIGSEDTKSGFSPVELLSCMSELIKLPNVTWQGVMSMPPLTEDEQKVRGFLRQTKDVFEKIKSNLPKEFISEWKHISMGTTHDFKIALQEGSTFIRVGTAIFGEREYT